MNYYRLLRDNKETGPYTQEELVAKGFKPYDLIWVEGKSAGWRYPSELPEFKSFAPIVEEQPYDRFYKKSAVAGEPVELLATATKTIKSSAKYNASAIGSHIHVTLPSGDEVRVKTVIVKKEEQELSKKQPIAESAAVINHGPDTSFAGSYFTPAEEAPLVLPAAGRSAGFSWTMIIGLVTGIATLVGLGIMIGMNIGRQSAVGSQQQAAAEKNTPPTVAFHAAAKTTPAVNEAADITVQPTVQQQPPAENTTAADQQAKPAVKNAVVKNSRQATGAANGNVSRDSKPVEINTQNTSEPIAVAPPHHETVSAEELAKMVDVRTNDYKIGAFGGISGLQCTISNTSKVALELVEVEVQYIQANDKVYKTEILSFKDIAAGAHSTLNAPKSSRGVKVISRIIKINPRETAFTNTTVKS